VAIAKQNELTPFYDPGTDITAYVTADVIGKRCVMISANRQAGPALNTSVSGGNLSVAPATAAGRIFGVAKWDAVTGQLVGVKRGNGVIVPIKAAGTIAAFAEVEVGTAGQVVTKSAGVAIGYAVSGAASGDDAQISLYRGISGNHRLVPRRPCPASASGRSLGGANEARRPGNTYGATAQSDIRLSRLTRFSHGRTAMAGPYAPGDQVAFLEYDPDGMRVWRAEVTEVVQQDIDSWRIETTHGAEVVNREGEGPSVAPMDEQIATEIVSKGDGFLVESTVRDIERHLEESPEWRSLERNIDRTLGRDGQER